MKGRIVELMWAAGAIAVGMILYNYAWPKVKGYFGIA